MMDGNTDNERTVKTRGNLKSNGCPGGYIKSWLDTRIKRSEHILFKVKGGTEGIKAFVRGNKLSVTGFEIIKNPQQKAVGLCVLFFY